MLLKPAVAVRMEHQYDLWSFRILQPHGETIGDRAGGQVLRLDVYVAAGSIEAVKKQGLDFIDRPTTIERRGGSRNRDGDIGQVSFPSGRPKMVMTHHRGKQNRAPGRSLPSVARQHTQRRSHGSAHHQLDIMKRPARAFVLYEQARGMVRKVMSGIPTALSEVQAADKGESIVDDDHFLMVGGPDRMSGIFHKMQSSVSCQL